MICRILRTVVLCFAAIVLCSSSAEAQGLIFSLPEDGQGVEYEGNLTQEMVRPDLEEGKEVLSWARLLSIKSVGREDAEYNGQVVPCRWIEIKIVTGNAGASGVDAGLVGARLYKVLVPESRVIDQPVDADNIPNSVLPIVRGYRRLGEEGVEEITSRGLVVYPILCLLGNYLDPETISASESISSIGGRDTFLSRHMKGRFVRERPDSRSTNVGEFWVSRDVPFGLAQWSVEVIREAKGSTEERSAFKRASTITCEMKVRSVLDRAESELVTE